MRIAPSWAFEVALRRPSSPFVFAMVVRYGSSLLVCAIGFHDSFLRPRCVAAEALRADTYDVFETRSSA
jgi:hypothetical protein